MRGRARVVGANAVEVGRRASIAPNASSSPPAAGRCRPTFPAASCAISSNEIFDLRAFPRRLVVVGGGYIACEFASIFHGLGAQVTQLYRGEQILRGFDDDVRDFLADEMRKKGVDLRTRAHVERIEPSAAARCASCCATAASSTPITVLYATGRNPNTAGLGLAEVGVALTANGAVVVDERLPQQRAQHLSRSAT